MNVEILILSGARQGETLRFDADELRVGDDPQCQVFFDPAQDAAGRGRQILICHLDDGWRIRSLAGGPVLLNHDTVSASARIRSGDVVRLSESGPDFCFNVVAAADLRQPALPVPPAPEAQPMEVPGVPMEAARPSAPELVREPAPLRQTVVDEPPIPAVYDDPWRPQRLVAGAALLAAVLMIGFGLARSVGLVGSSGRSGDRATSAALDANQPKGNESATERTASNSSVPAGRDYPSAATNRPAGGNRRESARPSAATASASRSGDAASNGRKRKSRGDTNKAGSDEAAPVQGPGAGKPPTGVLLALARTAEAPAEAESAGNDASHVELTVELTPFAVAGVVSSPNGELLVTNGYLAWLIASFPVQIWAVPFDGGADRKSRPLEIEQVFVHEVFAQAMEMNAGDAADEFALGILTVKGRLADACQAASLAELEPLRQGNTLRCWGVAKSLDPLHMRDGRLVQPPAPQSPDRIEANVKRKTGPGQASGAIGLLELTVPSGYLIDGAPVFNQLDQLVAVCAPISVADAGQTSKARLATLVAAETLSTWGPQGSKHWRLVPRAQLQEPGQEAVP